MRRILLFNVNRFNIHIGCLRKQAASLTYSVSLIADIGLRFRPFGVFSHPLVSALRLRLRLRLANDAAEIHRFELGILVCQYICFFVTKCRLWFVFNTVIKG